MLRNNLEENRENISTANFVNVFKTTSAEDAEARLRCIRKIEAKVCTRGFQEKLTAPIYIRKM
jgi:hypothetical protein